MLWWFCLLVPLASGQTVEDSCYSNLTDPYLFFSTKTSYFFVDNENYTDITVQGCVAKKYWTLVRHGTRNPGDDDILLMKKRGPTLRDEILESHNNGKGDLCQEDISNFRDWNFTLQVEDDSLLTDSGFKEMEELAARTKKRFSGLLQQAYAPETYTFRHTAKQRTEMSAKGFVKGIFPEDDVYIPPPIEDDPLLRFYDNCPKWINEIDENPLTYAEQELFKQSDAMTDALTSIQARLGLDELPFDDALLMFDMCRYDKAWEPDELSPWCAAFKEKDLKVMEYFEELEYYYKNGYANALNKMFACPLIKDLVKIMTDPSPHPLGTFYFSHSEAVLPFLTLLRLYEDPAPLKASNFAEMADRQYRTSLTGSFAANVAFVLYECEEEPKQRLMTMHQEEEIQLPRCDETLCDLQQFLEGYKNEIVCPFSAICSEGSLGTTNSSAPEDSPPTTEEETETETETLRPGQTGKEPETKPFKFPEEEEKEGGAEMRTVSALLVTTCLLLSV